MVGREARRRSAFFPLMLLLPLTTMVSAGGFLSSCFAISYAAGADILSATCETNSKKEMTTTMRLGQKCWRNDDGKIKVPGRFVGHRVSCINTLSAGQ